MDREHFYKLMFGQGNKDYELYLNTLQLLQCQKPFDKLCTHDELQFQIVHQVQELWMKLIGFSLLEIDDQLSQTNTYKVLTLFSRVHRIQGFIEQEILLLETMSLKDYQTIRLQLGNGSGQESPGFRTLLEMAPKLWSTFNQHYLEAQQLTVEAIYDKHYDHGDAYMIAEALIEFDERFQRFRQHHMQLIKRTIGIHSKSLKGRSVDVLEEGLNQQFYPKLWEVRAKMTDVWGGEYGVVRPSIHD